MKILVAGGACASHADEYYEHRPGYVFTNDPACTDYDWFVVYETLPDRCAGGRPGGFAMLRCPREQTIFCTCEPVSIKEYSRHFTWQFGHLLSNRPPEVEMHPHYHLGRGYFLWFNDRTFPENASFVIPPKTRVISTVCSSKRMRHTRHRDRFSLMQVLAEEIDGFDWFGRGVRPLGKKYEAMDPYRYHVVVENHVAPHHWTEKLADALLCECLPFYAGDPAIGEILPSECLIPIPIDDPPEAVRIIRSAIAAGECERRREAVLEAKRLILSRYNFWDQVIGVIEMSKGQKVSPPDPGKPVRIYSRHALRRHSFGAALEDGLIHLRRGFR